MTASVVCYRINTPALNGGAAEQPTLFKVVPEATTPEEEEEVKIYQKTSPRKRVAKRMEEGVIRDDTHT